jgi:hypothetical protein
VYNLNYAPTTLEVRFRGFRLTQLNFNGCLLFYSNYLLHVSVVRPSSRGNIYIQSWREITSEGGDALIHTLQMSMEQWWSNDYQTHRLGEKSIVASLGPPRISRDVTWDWTWGAVTFWAIWQDIDRLCGLVVRVLDPEVPGSIPGHCKKKKVVGLERGPLSLVSTTEELLGSNSSGSSVESREYGRRDSSRWPRGTLYPQKRSLACGLRPRSSFYQIGSRRNEAVGTQQHHFSASLGVSSRKGGEGSVLFLWEDNLRGWKEWGGADAGGKRLAVWRQAQSRCSLRGLHIPTSQAPALGPFWKVRQCEYIFMLSSVCEWCIPLCFTIRTVRWFITKCST